MRRLVAVLGVLTLTLAMAGAAWANGSASRVMPRVVSKHSESGPFAAATPDSGTCGNAWAVDQFNREFRVSPATASGTTVLMKFLNGRFITLGDGGTGSGPSPESCGNSYASGHVLREGVVGIFHGSFTIQVAPGFSYTGNGTCGTLADWPLGAGNGETPGDCTTGQWLAANFQNATGQSPTYPGDANVTLYSITYKAHVDGVAETWVNSSSGDSGDIHNP